MDTEFLYSCAGKWSISQKILKKILGKEYKENEGDLNQVETKILFPTHQSVAYSNYIQVTHCFTVTNKGCNDYLVIQGIWLESLNIMIIDL